MAYRPRSFIGIRKSGRELPGHGPDENPAASVFQVYSCACRTACSICHSPGEQGGESRRQACSRSRDSCPDRRCQRSSRTTPVRVVERVDHLRTRFVRAGYEHVFAAQSREFARAMRRDLHPAPRRQGGAPPGCSASARSCAAGARCARPRTVSASASASPRPEASTGSSTTGVRGCSARIAATDLRVARRAEHAELERRHRNVLEHAARLALDPARFDRKHALDAARVLHGESGQHRQRMAAEARDA